eukprot:9378378-Alexandrium_andersonii.AAC.1
MSASLVGSEMCIRDRLFPLAPPAHQKASPPLLPLLPGGGLGAGWEEGKDCLLYTSDAADDM